MCFAKSGKWDQSGWYESRIVSIKQKGSEEPLHKVHFVGWSSKYDEWVGLKSVLDHAAVLESISKYNPKFQPGKRKTRSLVVVVDPSIELALSKNKKSSKRKGARPAAGSKTKKRVKKSKTKAGSTSEDSSTNSDSSSDEEENGDDDDDDEDDDDSEDESEEEEEEEDEDDDDGDDTEDSITALEIKFPNSLKKQVPGFYHWLSCCSSAVS